MYYFKLVEEGNVCVQQLRLISEFFGEIKFGMASFTQLFYTMLYPKLRWTILQRLMETGCLIQFLQ